MSHRRRSDRDDARRPQMECIDLGGSGKFKSWQLAGTKYFVQHCGHPTANYPWYGTTPRGEMLTSGPRGKTGLAFRYLDDAKVACELHRARRLGAIALFKEHRSEAA